MHSNSGARLPFEQSYKPRFVELFKDACKWYTRYCLSTKKHTWTSDKLNPRIWYFTRVPTFDDCVKYITRKRNENSLELWEQYILRAEWCVEDIHKVIRTIEQQQSIILDGNDNEMNRIITTQVHKLTSKDPPKKAIKLNEFINMIPYGHELANEYKNEHRLGDIRVAYEPFAENTVKGHKTVKEWYEQYVERFEQARRSIQIDKDSSKGQALNKKGIPKPPTKNTDERPVHDKDVLAYPFKSKLKQYRKTVDADVPYIEPPEQPRIQYQILHRPYFSHEPGCWEIDHAFNVLEDGDKWMFCINVNTRYLVVYNIAERVSDVWVSLMDLHARYKIKSIRGDGSNSYCLPEYRNRVMTPEMLQQEYESGKLTKDSGEDASTYTLMRWYMRNNITIYFNSSPFTLHNKIVDVAIKTIRNAIGYRRLKPEHMNQLVKYYNNTVHKSIGCTPSEMQDNPEIEYQYIRWCERKLSEVIANQKRLGYLDYKPGNVLMVHIDKGKTSEKHEKRRRFFDKLGVFVKYDHGNVVVDMLVKGVRVHSTGQAKMRLTVPVYHTKFVSERVQTIPPEYKDYYINSMKVLEVDDIYNMPVSDKNNEA